MSTDYYRDEIAAARLRIEQLEHELAVFRADPAYERVEIAEERLGRARSLRERAQQVLPRLIVGSVALIATFALTHPDLPELVRGVAYVLFAVGVVAACVTTTALLVVNAQGRRPKRIVELERQLRIAKADVGARSLQPPRRPIRCCSSKHGRTRHPGPDSCA